MASERRCLTGQWVKSGCRLTKSILACHSAACQPLRHLLYSARLMSMRSVRSTATTDALRIQSSLSNANSPNVLPVSVQSPTHIHTHTLLDSCRHLTLVLNIFSWLFWPTVLSVAPLLRHVVCLSVCRLSSVTFCILAKRYVLAKK